jgi:glycosyltransferase involved in cell wall biosynthesis
MACGSPVASSHASSLPELGGDIARYFDPYNLDEMVVVLGNLLDDTTLREKLSQQGISHSSAFSWERAARETIAVYNGLVEQPFATLE